LLHLLHKLRVIRKGLACKLGLKSTCILLEGIKRLLLLLLLLWGLLLHELLHLGHRLLSLLLWLLLETKVLHIGLKASLVSLRLLDLGLLTIQV